MLGYLRGLTLPRLVLWCYLVWYLVVLVRYFDATPALWINSLGISAIIGTALYLSTAHAGHTRTRLDRWQIFRLYLMPLCVSSFAALIKGRGFVLVLHPDLAGNLLSFGLVAALCAVVWLAKRSAAANVAANDASAPLSVASCASAQAGLQSPRGISAPAAATPIGK